MAPGFDTSRKAGSTQPSGVTGQSSGQSLARVLALGWS